MISSLVGAAAAISSLVGAAAGCAVGCSVVACPMAACSVVVCSMAAGSDGLEPPTTLGSTSKAMLQFHPIINAGILTLCKTQLYFSTYRLELLCDVEQILRLAPPAATTGCAWSGCACSIGACAAGGSSADRSLGVGTTSGRLRGSQTRFGAASSSSSSSSTTRSSRRCFGARAPEAEPWTDEGPWADSVATTPTQDGPPAIGLLPATLSSVVGAGRSSSSSLLVY